MPVAPVDTPDNTVAEVTDATFGRIARPLLALSSTIRRRGIVHPGGSLVSGGVEIYGDHAYTGTMLSRPRRFDALVRFSRTLGLPGRSPDAFGVAVRIFDADGAGDVQDLLVLSSAEAPVARQVILPAAGHAAGFRSSITPFRIAGHHRFLGARPERAAGVGALADLDELETAIGAGELGFNLVAATTTGGWRPVGRLRLDRVEPADTARPEYNAFNQAGGLEPVGALNGIRRRAYFGSQDARTA